MLSEVLLLVGCLIFYALGRLHTKEGEVAGKVSKHLSSIKKKPIAGVIDYPTPIEQEYRGSEEEKADIDRDRAAREAGLIQNDV